MGLLLSHGGIISILVSVGLCVGLLAVILISTVTFSYTAAFWNWTDWELELDWLALRGVNLPLAWVGQEKILVEAFLEVGFTEAEIASYLSGPAFQAWNRFGNIQGSWDGGLPMEWIDAQFALQKNITQRMVELGMTPVLPCFTGFVPRALDDVLPGAEAVNGTAWEDFPAQYTNVTFLEPSDPNFTILQKSFISKQTEAYGNITHIYTLDQYNEDDPFSGDLDYLGNVSYNTWKSLKDADPEAVWLMQGWLFFSSETFWTAPRIEAYLGGVEENSDMLILDLFSESSPQWQRTNSYYGKPWIWCQLHGYGGNLGLYGQIENITVNSVDALANSSSLVGFGLTMEAQEGNEVMYDLLLDQAWSGSPINTTTYFHNWVTRRYGSSDGPPHEDLYTAWEMMRSTVYNNTNLTAATAVTKSIFELSPNITGMLGRTGHHATTLTYSPDVLVSAWNLMFAAAGCVPGLWDNPAYEYDMVDITRQVMSNSFADMYESLIDIYTTPSPNMTAFSLAGANLTSLLTTLDSVLLTSPSFSLATWLNDAKSQTTNSTLAQSYEYSARNQITLWGPTGEINDYASKAWGGLVAGYYAPRWEIFLAYLNGTPAGSYNATDLDLSLSEFELKWQNGSLSYEGVAGPAGDLSTVLGDAVQSWGGVFAGKGS